MSLLKPALWPAILCGLLHTSGASADSSALWNIVHGQCVPHAQHGEGPSPCADIALGEGEQRGVSLLKDRVGIAQHLLIPTWRISGIEDTSLMSAQTPNLWQAAWQERRFVAQSLGHPLDDRAFGMAINSAYARSQDQFHIHLDCLSPAATAAFPELMALTANQWTNVNAPLPGGHYRALRLEAADLTGVAPFQLLADSLPPETDMGHQSLAIVTFAAGDGTRSFVLLATSFDPLRGERGHAEDLLDQSCAGAGVPAN